MTDPSRHSPSIASGWVGRLMVVLVRGYQVLVSPILGPACRYEPSCSSYAVEAIEAHGVLRGSWLAFRRLARCHPLGGHGYDPVPLGSRRGS